jgi:hypothetical protein
MPYFYVLLWETVDYSTPRLVNNPEHVSAWNDKETPRDPEHLLSDAN